MTDNYLGFTYGGTHSSVYNAFIVNEGSDLKFYNTPSFSNEFAFPKFGENSVLLGINKENREISFRLFLKEVSLTSYREFLNWLKPNPQSKAFYFDYESEFEYNVVVNSIGEGSFTVNPNCGVDNETYNVELDISFSTVGDYAAVARNLAPVIFNNDLLATTGVVIGDSYANIQYSSNTLTLTIENDLNEDFFFTLVINNMSASIIENVTIDQIEFDIPAQTTVYFYSKYGILIDQNNNFIPYKGVMSSISVTKDIQKNINLNYQSIASNSVTLLPISREII